MDKEHTKPTLEVTAEALVKELTQDAGTSLLPLHHARVKGDFNLKHLVIDKPVVIRDCRFEGKVDLRYCEFKQVVDFSECTFEGEFNSGDEVECHTIYRKDLICNRARFEETASFDGIRVEGNGYFSESHFLKGEELTDFSGASFDLTVDCTKAVFLGPAKFTALRCNGFGLFSEATFQTGADFSYASFGKNLECRGATFQGAVTFYLLKCDGNGLFDSLDEVPVRCREEITFTEAAFGVDLYCDQAVFEGLASFDEVKCRDLYCTEATFEKAATFNSLKCGESGFLNNTKFQDEEPVDFSYASFGGSLVCEGAMFQGGARFPGTSFSGNLDCNGATFEGEAAFTSLRCEGFGAFNETRFLNEQETDFSYATFDKNLECGEATFRGGASFNSLKCSYNGFFDKTRFLSEQEVDFSHASFGENLQCNEVIFMGGTNFSSLECGNSGWFVKAEFLSERKANFIYASFGGNLVCTEANFKGEVSFSALKCGGVGWFNGTRFECKEEVSFGFTQFGGKLEFASAQFAGSVNLSAASISQELSLTGAQFEHRVTLYDASIDLLVLDDDRFPFKEGSLDLRGFTFNRFKGPAANSEERAIAFATAQDPTIFSRDPYLQLEKYYENIGDDSRGRRVYYQGRSEFREKARTQNKWSLMRSILDWFWKVLTGYGIKIWPLLAISSVFLVIGTLVFYVPQDTLTKANGPASIIPWEEGLLYRFLYSLDLFLPIVNLRVDEQWVPNGLLLQEYATIHTLVGWLIVPLLLAALAGIMRR